MTFCALTFAAVGDVDITYWHEVILFLASFGSFGGMLGVLRHLEPKECLIGDTPLYSSRYRLWGALLVGALGGIGGAFGFLTVLIIDGKLDAPLHDKTRLMLCSAGVISGFIGYQLLTLLSRNLEDKLKAEVKAEAKAEAEKVVAAVSEGTQKVVAETQNIKTELARMEEMANDSALLSMAYTAAENSLVNPDTRLIQECIRKLTDLLKRQPRSRIAAIILGRLYCSLNRIPEAIIALTTTIKAKESANQNDVDKAALLYNRSCYNSRLYEHTNDVAFRETAIADFLMAINIDPLCGSEGVDDPDLTTLKEDPRFASAVEKSRGSGGTSTEAQSGKSDGA